MEYLPNMSMIYGEDSIGSNLFGNAHDCKDYRIIFHFSLDFSCLICYIMGCSKNTTLMGKILQAVRKSELDSGK